MNTNTQSNSYWYRRGLKDGIPIALGYFAVSFTLGIAAKNAGLSALQASLTSILCLASAGEYAGFTLIAASASYLETAVMTLVINARYLLMSCALSQKIAPETSLPKRLLLGYPVTDEIFGVAMSVNGRLNPFYNYGMVSVAAPGWTVGTGLGVIMGNLLPANVVSALSVGLYGMFLAVIVPPARGNRIIGALVLLSMAASYAVSRIPQLDSVSDGMKIIVLTIVISLLAALLFPVQDGHTETEHTETDDKAASNA